MNKKPNSCLTAQQIYAFIDGELPQEGRTAVSTHAEACPPCAQQIDQEKRTGEIIARVGSLVTAPSALRDRIASAMQAESANEPEPPIGEAVPLPPRSGFQNISLGRFAVAAMVLVAVGLGINMLFTSDTSAVASELGLQVREKHDTYTAMVKSTPPAAMIRQWSGVTDWFARVNTPEPKFEAMERAGFAFLAAFECTLLEGESLAILFEREGKEGEDPEAFTFVYGIVPGISDDVMSKTIQVVDGTSFCIDCKLHIEGFGVTVMSWREGEVVTGVCSRIGPTAVLGIASDYVKSNARKK